MPTTPQVYFAAIAAGDARSLQSCLEAAPELVRERHPGDGSAGSGGQTGLHLCVRTGSPAMAEMLLAGGVDLEARNEEGRTALHDALEFGQREIEEVLHRHGANLDICAAAILGRVERVRELLDAEPEQVNDASTRLSPLGWASYGNQARTAKLLVDRGARMDDGELLCAASVGHVEVGRVLIVEQAEINAIHEQSGCAALHAAAMMRYAGDTSAFISMLLAAGADVMLRARNGRTALELAEECARRQEAAVAAAGAQGAPPRKNYAAVIRILRDAEMAIL